MDFNLAKIQLFSGLITLCVIESAMAKTLTFPAASSLIASFPSFRSMGLIEGLTPVASQCETSDLSKSIRTPPLFILPIKERRTGKSGLIYHA